MLTTSNIQHYEKLLEDNPRDADALHALSILLAQTQHYAEALDKVQQAIDIKPTDASYYNSLGNIFRRLHQLDQAQSAYQKAIKINSRYAIAHNNLGNVFFQKNELVSAKKSYEKAIVLKENYADAYVNLGILLAKIENDEAAITALQKAISINPHLLSALNQLGDCYLRCEKYEAACDLFSQYVDKNPQSAESQHRLGIAYFSLHNFDQAKQQFERALTLNHGHNEANQYLANTYLELRDHEKAMHHYFRQLDINPLFDTYYNLGVLLMMKDRFKDALLYFDEALKINANDSATHLNCGSIYLKSNQLEKAVLSYESALQLNPHDEEIKHILSAIKQHHTPSNAPSSYVTHLFDQYAAYYDVHLTQRLEYTVPQKIVDVLQLTFPTLSDLTVVDLGCGTGLLGELLEPFSKKSVGVDLSENMLSIAREKNCYHELICADIVDALPRFSSIDLISAADVFAYLGDLDPVFSAAKQALTKEGLFVFTIEKTIKNDYVLQTSIRYAHSKKYIESLCDIHSFEIVCINNIVLRKQRNESVEGYLVVLRNVHEITPATGIFKLTQS